MFFYNCLVKYSLILALMSEIAWLKKFLNPSTLKIIENLSVYTLRAWSHSLRLPKIKAQALGPVKPWWWLWQLGLGSASLGPWAQACTTLNVLTRKMRVGTKIWSHCWLCTNSLGYCQLWGHLPSQDWSGSLDTISMFSIPLKASFVSSNLLY